MDIDKDWIPVILAIVTGVFGGIAHWWKSRREDKLRDLTKIDDLQKMITTMQQERIREEIAKNEVLLAAKAEASENVTLQAELVSLLRGLKEGKDAA